MAKAKAKRVSVLGNEASDVTTQKYEVMFILSPMLTEDKRKKVVAELDALLAAKKADVFHVDDWGKRDIAYTIKKHNEGYYMVYYFNLADRQALTEIDEHMRLDQNILRHLFMKRDENYQIRDFEALEQEKIERGGPSKEQKEKAKAKKDAAAKKAPSKKQVEEKMSDSSSDTDGEV